MANTPNLILPVLSASQSQKHVTVNEALRVLDAVQSMPTILVLDKDLTAPPGSPSDGDIYIPAVTATGDWVGQEGKIAYYDSTGWVFYTAAEGWLIYLVDENLHQQFDGAAWIGFPNSIQNIVLLGVNTTADATNKLAVASTAVLFTNIGNGIQIKLNKAASADTNSFLFQTNWVGFAEFGCTGDDDFHFKVSPNNFTTTYEAFVIANATGNVDFKQNLTAHGGDLITSHQVTVTSANVAVGATYTLITAVTGDQWKLVEILLAGFGTNFSGGGDRDLAIQDVSGTVVYTVIPAATLQALAAGRWGSVGIPFPAAAADLLAASTAGEHIVAKYSGGTTDYTAGALTVVLNIKKVT